MLLIQDRLYTGSKQNKKTQRWFQVTDSDAIAILIGNKFDLERQRTVKESEGEKVKKSTHHIYISLC